MGHLVGKDIYWQLGKTIDKTPVRTPWNNHLYDLLKSLYSPEEAELITRMPYRPSPLSRVSKLCGVVEDELLPKLEQMCNKGLVCDIWEGNEYLYMISPIVVGFFEFTMMRTGKHLPHKQWAELFQAYMFGDKAFLEANFGNGQQISVMRAMPHEETIAKTEHVEIMDYEKASALIARHTTFALSNCSCRHEKLHLGEKYCNVPLDTCTTFGSGAEFLIRNNLARPIDKAEMIDILARSRDMGFTLSVDNVKQDVGFMCHCCGCCCNLLQGIRETGYTNTLVSSSFIAKVESADCIGCGKCVKACPINAITIHTAENTDKRIRYAEVDTSKCIGCGVCALKCPTKALQLKKRTQRIIHPEDSFERVILQSLERGTLQNLIFDNPNSRKEEYLRGLVGGFLKLSPVKKALMSDQLRSRFLNALRTFSD